MKRQVKNKTVETASSFSRGLEVLLAFKADDGTLGNKELVERTGLPKATVSRLTASLASLGYLAYESRLGRYRIGPMTISLGYVALSSLGVIQRAKPLMEEIAHRTGCSVVLGARNATDIVCLAQTTSKDQSMLNFTIGSRLPIWRTAIGLAYLTKVNAKLRSDLLHCITEQEYKHDEVILNIFQESIKEEAEFGFVTDFGSWYSYINSVGIAFQPKGESTIFAASCFGVSSILTQGTVSLKVGYILRDIITRL